MLQLYCQMNEQWDEEPFVARVTTDCRRAAPLREREVLFFRTGEVADGFRGYLTFNATDRPGVMVIPTAMDYLVDGDILYVSPKEAELSVLYRRHSNANVIVPTESCNCRCIMCPQPSKNRPDNGWVQAWLEAIPLMSQDTTELAVCGGEPTMVPEGLLKIVLACRNYLSQTALHVLSNGRLFNYLSYCQKLAAIGHPDLMLGIPIYSDLPYMHDFIVQAEGAFDQTVRGIMNLRRCKQRIEVRVVLIQQNINRLVDLAYFIARNMPFVDHVALMGMEPMGRAAVNWNELWVDPADYQPMLKAAVEMLAGHGVPVSIYNHQLCILDQTLWPFARKSISDWKNEFLDICRDCAVQTQCGGFFSSAIRRHSRCIRAVT